MKSAQVRPKPVRLWSNLRETRHNWPALVETQPNQVEYGPEMDEVGPHCAEIASNLGQARSNSADPTYKGRPELVDPICLELGPNGVLSVRAVDGVMWRVCSGGNVQPSRSQSVPRSEFQDIARSSPAFCMEFDALSGSLSGWG